MKSDKATLESILSIQIRLDGFSFYVRTSDQGEFTHEVAFSAKETTSDALLNQFKKAFEQNPALHQKYEHIQVIHANPWATLVPNDYFKPEYCAHYLSKNIKLLKDDFFAYDVFKNMEATCVYLPFVGVNNFLLERHHTFSYFHESLLLIDALLEEKTAAPTFFINVFKGLFYLVCVDDGRLKYYNSFQPKTDLDALYYIRFAMVQQASADAPIFIFGDLDKHRFLYRTLKKYLPKIQVFQSASNNTLSKNTTLQYIRHLS